jgi:hypothetical protein
MSKYIPQINETNFVYPNFEIAEYDVDIIHNINNNSVSGTVNSLAVSGTARTTGMTLNANITWNRNNADVFLNNSNQLSFLSVHMMGPTQQYYKPWRLVKNDTTSSVTATTVNIVSVITVTPSQLGLTSFTSGTYNFEFRFIGLKSIFPVCRSLSITVT